MSTTNQKMPTKNPQSDGELLHAYVERQDHAAFAELVRRHQGIVWGVCRRVLRDRFDAEDAFQTTFATFAANAIRIRKPGSLSAWLHSVAVKTAHRIRQRRSQATIAFPDQLAGPTREPFEEIAHQHRIAIVDQQLLSLTDKYRIPMVLFYFRNRTTSQIATEMNLSRSAVEGRLKRGRQQLKRELLRHGIQDTNAISSQTITPPPEVHSTVRSASPSKSCANPSMILTTLFGGKSMLTKTAAAIVASLAIATGTTMHGACPFSCGTASDGSGTVVETVAMTNMPTTDSTATLLTTDSTADAVSEQSLHDWLRNELIEVHDDVYNWIFEIDETSEPAESSAATPADSGCAICDIAGDCPLDCCKDFCEECRVLAFVVSAHR